MRKFSKKMFQALKFPCHCNQVSSISNTTRVLFDIFIERRKREMLTEDGSRKVSVCRVFPL